MKSIWLANSYGIKVSCIATFTSISAPRWKEVFDFFVSENLCFNVHPSISPFDKDTKLEITPEQYLTLFTEMFDYYLQNRKRIRVASFDQFCRGAACNEGQVCTFWDCLGMFLAVDPYGDIYSCQRFAGKKEYRLGNIVSSPTMQELMDSRAAGAFLTRQAGIAGKCGDCSHYAYCRGGCAYNAWSKSNESGALDPFCETYKEIYSIIKNKLRDEMISEENIRAIESTGIPEVGNPLLKEGAVISLTKEHTHPYNTARTAKRIIAAYELAACASINKAAKNLAERGIAADSIAAKKMLSIIKDNMNPEGGLNKLYIHVTWDCQLRCSHCYAAVEEDKRTLEMNAKVDIDRCASEMKSEVKGGRRALEMNTADLMKLISQAAECSFKEVVITGGEPLLHSERSPLLEGLAAYRRKAIPVKLILRTNFTMPLSEEDMLLVAQAFNEVVVSIDGDKQAHDERRGAGAYDSAVRNIEKYCEISEKAIYYGSNRLIPARLTIAASMRSEHVNSPQGNAVRDLARRLSLRYKFRPLLPLGRAQNIEEPVTSEALKAYLTPSEQMELGFNPVMTCGMGQNLYVEPSGDAFPCYSYKKSHAYLGNVILEGLDEIIESRKFKSLQRHTSSSKFGEGSGKHTW